MNQTNGGITVDEGYRAVEPSSSSGSSKTRAEQRASRSSPGVWDESLGKWGSEEWVLPGQGNSGAGCGVHRPGAVCDEHGHVEYKPRVCGKRSCPDCWGSWAKKAAVRASVRIQGFRHTQPDNHRRQVAHVYVSPPEGEIMNERQFFEGRSKAEEIAKEKGFRGFAVIPHPYRVTEEGQDRYNAVDPDYGIWVWLRKDVEDMEQYIYWSPHYHIIGVTSADMEPAEDSDEWVYQFRRSLTPYRGMRDSESHNDLYGTFRYLLSHTGYPAGSTKQVTTWYGDLANNVFVEEASEEWQQQKPPEHIRESLKAEVEEVAGVEVEEEGEGGVEEDLELCPVEGCGGRLIDVFDVGAYLRQCEPPPEVRDRMVVARDWRLGRIEPPPGLKRPSSEEEARESFEAML